MTLPDEAIKEYQAIHKKVYGENISEQQARVDGESLLRLFKVVYRPIKKEWLEELKEKDKHASPYSIETDGKGRLWVRDVRQEDKKQHGR